MKSHPSILAACFLILPISLARASTFSVTNNDDSGPGSFRAAIEGVNSDTDPGRSDIIFSANAHDIVLESALPGVTHSVQIDGHNTSTGVNVTLRRLSTSPAFRLLDLSPNLSVILSAMNLSGGSAADGGLIRNGGSLWMRRCTLSESNGTRGGAIFNGVAGEITVENSTFSNNTSQDGGALFNEGYLEVYTSLLTGNSAERGGAAESFYEPKIGGPGGVVRFYNSTVTGNTASVAGGGVYISSSSLNLNSSTVVGNTSPEGTGAGLHFVAPFKAPGDSVLIFENSILAGNTPAGDGISITDVFRGMNTDYSLSSAGHNLTGTVLGGTNPFTAEGDLTGFTRTTIGVADLSDNGGPTRTMALLPGSPALDAGASEFGADQRGAGRPLGIQDDIGACEGTASGNHAPFAQGIGFGTRIGNFVSIHLPASDIDNDALTYSIESGAVPAGLTLDSATGILSGTPNKIGVGTFSYHVSDGQALSNSTSVEFGIMEAESTVVNTTGPANYYDGKTSLNEAIDCAYEKQQPTDVTFNLPSNDRAIKLVFPVIVSGGNISIIGPTSGPGVTIQRSTQANLPAFSNVRIYGGVITLKNLTITGGDAGPLDATDPIAGRGGGILHLSGNLRVENCTLVNNSAAQGGGIYNTTNDAALGTTIINSTITGNIATAVVGSGSTDDLTGGGIAVAKGNVSLDSCTVVGNRAAAGTGAGISSVSDGSALVHVSNSIIAGNLTAQGAADSNTDMVGSGLRATANAFSSGGGNVVGGGNGGNAFTAANDLAKVSSADLKLGALAQNGGPTATMALLFGSPAVDRSNTTLLNDQRGESRPYGKAADSGAFEVHNFAPNLKNLNLTPDAPFQNDTLNATVVANDPDGTTPTLTYTWTKTRNGKSTILRAVGNTLPTSGQDIVVGDIIIVTVVASDGVSTSSPLSASVTIRNHPISISNLSLQPKNPYTNEQMVATVKMVDADKTRPFYSFYWTCNGMAVQSVVNSRSSQDFYNLNLPGHGDKRDLIEVTVVVSDGSSTATAKTNARVLNSIPTISALSLAPQAPLPTGIVTATYAGRDADGDILTKIYQWKIGKKVLVTEKGSRLNLANYPATKPGDVISCTMRLSDGESLSKTLVAQVTVAGPAATSALTAPFQGDSSAHSS